MNIIDISWPLTPQTTAYKNNKTITFTPLKSVVKDGVSETLISLSSHSGTHVDAPAHFIQDAPTIEQASLERFVGPCTVIDLSHITSAIHDYHLQEFQIEEGMFLLLKTANSKRQPTDPFNPDFIYLHATAAAYLVERNIGLIGFDYLGIERQQIQHETHHLLMDADIMIVEGLRLAQVKPGPYLFVCLPLAVAGLDAAPARAILVAGL